MIDSCFCSFLAITINVLRLNAYLIPMCVRVFAFTVVIVASFFFSHNTGLLFVAREDHWDRMAFSSSSASSLFLLIAHWSHLCRRCDASRCSLFLSFFFFCFFNIYILDRRRVKHTDTRSHPPLNSELNAMISSSK